MLRRSAGLVCHVGGAGAVRVRSGARFGQLLPSDLVVGTEDFSSNQVSIPTGKAR
jgi:hypothetical protein